MNDAGAQETVDMVTGDSGEAEAFHLNVSDAETVQQVVAAVHERFGRIDVLINNAGVVGELVRTHEVSEL